MKISLIGYMGSGKTTIGKLLAKKLSTDFRDLDILIEQSGNKSISEMFAEAGEIKFRKLEREILLDALLSVHDFVVALGGGTPAYYDNMEKINECSTSFYLRSNPANLAQRLRNEKSHRPLIAHLHDEDLPEFVAKHLFERRNYYEKAHHIIDVDLKSPHEIVAQIIRLIPHPK